MSTRKRDDVEDFLYRVVERRKGSDDPWVWSNCGNYGKPRTYVTIGAARGQRSISAYNKSGQGLEFAVQRAPVTDWEIV